MDEIKVTKESVGESINLYPESSDESVDFQVKRKIKNPNVSRRVPVTSSPPIRTPRCPCKDV